MPRKIAFPSAASSATAAHQADGSATINNSPPTYAPALATYPNKPAAIKMHAHQNPVRRSERDRSMPMKNATMPTIGIAVAEYPTYTGSISALLYTNRVT